MKLVSLVFLLVVAISGFANDKKADKVLIFVGGSLDNPVHLGAYHGLLEKGWNPDLIISSCGGSIMNGVIQSHATPQEQEKFVKSDEFHKLYQTAKVSQDWQGLANLVKRSGEISKKDTLDLIPKIYTSPVLDIPQDINLKPFDQPPQSAKPEAIIIATEVNFDESETGKPRNGKVLMNEVLFTNDRLATMIKNSGFTAPKSIAEGRISPEIKVLTGVKLNEAVRAGISEPTLLEPKKIDGKTYIAGAIDFYPLELAKLLSNPNAEIIFVLPGKFTAREAIPSFNAFGFDMRDEYEALLKKKGYYIINVEDMKDALGDNLFWPKPKIGLGGAKILVNVPEKLEQFQAIIDAQLKYGKERAYHTLNKIEQDRQAIQHRASSRDQHAEGTHSRQEALK